VINETGNEKCSGDQVILKRSDEKYALTHYLEHDVME
jgi:hypothetical protein